MITKKQKVDIMNLETQEPTRQELINERTILRNELVATLKVEKSQKASTRVTSGGSDQTKFLGLVGRGGITTLLLDGYFKSFDSVHLSFFNPHQRGISYRDAFTEVKMEEIIADGNIGKLHKSQERFRNEMKLISLSWDDLHNLKVKNLRDRLQMIAEILV
jgi:hypothetical protein